MIGHIMSIILHELFAAFCPVEFVPLIRARRILRQPRSPHICRSLPKQVLESRQIHTVSAVSLSREHLDH